MATIKSLLFCFSLVAIVSGQTEAQDISKWEVAEINVKSKRIKSDPFQVEIKAIFSHEGGASLEVPGFYHGDNAWTIRYSLPQEGTWQYLIQSPEKSLDGNQGEIVVGPNKSDQHGPIIIPDDNRTRFSYADGSPYNLLAYELDWLFALDAENAEDIPRTREIISAIKSNGFNQVVMNVYAFDASWGERDKINPMHNFAEPQVFPFAGTNDQPDFSTLNLDFFNHLDRVIAHLNEQNIVAHLMIYVWNKKVNWPEPKSAEDNMYFDYVAKRYQAFPNMVWDISKEALAYGRDDMGYITDRIHRLRKLDGHERLISVHDYNYCAAFPDQVDFISIQEWSPNIYNKMLDVAEKHPDQPVFNIEHGGYETTMHRIFAGGAYTDPATCLRRNYECAFAGAYTTYYWQNTSWYEVVFNPNELPEENQPNLAWYQHFGNLLETYQFEQLMPWQNAFTTYGLYDGAETLLLFIPEKMERLSGTVPFLQHKKVSITWFDPFTGVTYDGPEREFEEGTWMGFQVDERISAPFGVAVLKFE